MGAEGPINWLVIDQYCKTCSIYGLQRQDLFYHIAKLDNVYLEHRLAEMDKNAKNRGKRNGKSR